jgi:hypothetical protein
MSKYEDFDKCFEALQKAQEADHDNRERAREADLFVEKRDGMWEPHWYQANDSKPRYTFDLTTPIIEQIAGELEEADFAIRVDPAGGEATKDDAELLAGLIRHIENISDARTKVYAPALKGCIRRGIDGWRVVQKYVDDDSFDQELALERISNFQDRVWFDETSEQPDHSDAKYCWVLQSLSKEDYEERWPDRKHESLNSDNQSTAYWHKPDAVIVGEYYYFKEEERELVLMTNGAVYENNEDFQTIRDELEAVGITVERTRKRKKRVVCVRKFDRGGWLEESKRTVFGFIPVVPEYANFEIIDNKIVYRGVVEKLLDPQRVLNYSLSREIEEGALAPRAKYWMTDEQAVGHEESLATLNTNHEPVQFYNPDERVPNPPQQVGGAQINPGLRNISQAMNEVINQTAGLFAANMGDNPRAQSGIAIERLQNKGDNGTTIYKRAHEVAICHTFRIIASAIPEVYKEQRQVRILNEDRTDEVVTLNQVIIDQQTGKKVLIHDLSRGTYKITCRAGPAFKNRQEQTVQNLIEVAKVDPSIVQIGGDILLSNINAPGMDLLAGRKRKQLMDAGIIPFEEMTDEEKQQFIQKLQQEAQNPKQDPAMLIGQAEIMKAQNEVKKSELDVQEKQIKLGLDSRKQQLSEAEFQARQQKEMFDRMLRAQEQQQAQQNMMIDALHKHAQTLKSIREAMGIDAVVSESGAAAFEGQAQVLNDLVSVARRQNIPVFDYDPLTGRMNGR